MAPRLRGRITTGNRGRKKPATKIGLLRKKTNLSLVKNSKRALQSLSKKNCKSKKRKCLEVNQKDQPGTSQPNDPSQSTQINVDTDVIVSDSDSSPATRHRLRREDKSASVAKSPSASSLSEVTQTKRESHKTIAGKQLSTTDKKEKKDSITLRKAVLSRSRNKEVVCKNEDVINRSRRQVNNQALVDASSVITIKKEVCDGSQHETKAGEPKEDGINTRRRQSSNKNLVDTSPVVTIKKEVGDYKPKARTGKILFKTSSLVEEHKVLKAKCKPKIICIPSSCSGSSEDDSDVMSDHEKERERQSETGLSLILKNTLAIRKQLAKERSLRNLPTTQSSQKDCLQQRSSPRMNVFDKFSMLTSSKVWTRQSSPSRSRSSSPQKVKNSPQQPSKYLNKTKKGDNKLENDTEEPSETNIGDNDDKSSSTVHDLKRGWWRKKAVQIAQKQAQDRGASRKEIFEEMVKALKMAEKRSSQHSQMVNKFQITSMKKRAEQTLMKRRMALIKARQTRMENLRLKGSESKKRRLNKESELKNSELKKMKLNKLIERRLFTDTQEGKQMKHFTSETRMSPLRSSSTQSACSLNDERNDIEGSHKTRRKQFVSKYEMITKESDLSSNVTPDTQISQEINIASDLRGRMYSSAIIKASQAKGKADRKNYAQKRGNRGKARAIATETVSEVKKRLHDDSEIPTTEDTDRDCNNISSKKTESHISIGPNTEYTHKKSVNKKIKKARRTSKLTHKKKTRHKHMCSTVQFNKKSSDTTHLKTKFEESVDTLKNDCTVEKVLTASGDGSLKISAMSDILLDDAHKMSRSPSKMLSQCSTFDDKAFPLSATLKGKQIFMSVPVVKIQPASMEQVRMAMKGQSAMLQSPDKTSKKLSEFKTDRTVTPLKFESTREPSPSSSSVSARSNTSIDTIPAESETTLDRRRRKTVIYKKQPTGSPDVLKGRQICHKLNVSLSRIKEDISHAAQTDSSFDSSSAEERTHTRRSRRKVSSRKVDFTSINTNAVTTTIQNKTEIASPPENAGVPDTNIVRQSTAIKRIKDDEGIEKLPLTGKKGPQAHLIFDETNIDEACSMTSTMKEDEKEMDSADCYPLRSAGIRIKGDNDETGSIVMVDDDLQTQVSANPSRYSGSKLYVDSLSSENEESFDQKGKNTAMCKNQSKKSQGHNILEANILTNVHDNRSRKKLKSFSPMQEGSSSELNSNDEGSLRRSRRKPSSAKKKKIVDNTLKDVTIKNETETLGTSENRSSDRVSCQINADEEEKKVCIDKLSVDNKHDVLNKIVLNDAIRNEDCSAESMPSSHDINDDIPNVENTRYDQPKSLVSEVDHGIDKPATIQEAPTSNVSESEFTNNANDTTLLVTSIPKIIKTPCVINTEENEYIEENTPVPLTKDTVETKYATSDKILFPNTVVEENECVSEEVNPTQGMTNIKEIEGKKCKIYKDKDTTEIDSNLPDLETGMSVSVEESDRPNLIIITETYKGNEKNGTSQLTTEEEILISEINEDDDYVKQSTSSSAVDTQSYTSPLFLDLLDKNNRTKERITDKNVCLPDDNVSFGDKKTDMNLAMAEKQLDHNTLDAENESIMYTGKRVKKRLIERAEVTDSERDNISEEWLPNENKLEFKQHTHYISDVSPETKERIISDVNKVSTAKGLECEDEVNLQAEAAENDAAEKREDKIVSSVSDDHVDYAHPSTTKVSHIVGEDKYIAPNTPDSVKEVMIENTLPIVTDHTNILDVNICLEQDKYQHGSLQCKESVVINQVGIMQKVSEKYSDDNTHSIICATEHDFKQRSTKFVMSQESSDGKMDTDQLNTQGSDIGGDKVILYEGKCDTVTNISDSLDKVTIEDTFSNDTNHISIIQSKTVLEDETECHPADRKTADVKTEENYPDDNKQVVLQDTKQDLKPAEMQFTLSTESHFLQNKDQIRTTEPSDNRKEFVSNFESVVDSQSKEMTISVNCATSTERCYQRDLSEELCTKSTSETSVLLSSQQKSVSPDTCILSTVQQKTVSIENENSKVSDIISEDTDFYASDQQRALSVANEDNMISDGVSSHLNNILIDEQNTVSIDNLNRITDDAASDTVILSRDQQNIVSVDIEDSSISESVSSYTEQDIVSSYQDNNLNEQHKAVSIDDKNRISDSVSSDTEFFLIEQKNAISIHNDDNMISDIVSSDTDNLSSEHLNAVSIDNDDNKISDIVSSNTDNLSSEHMNAISINNDDNMLSDIVSSDTDNLSKEHLNAVSIDNDEKRISDTVSSDTDILSSEHLKAVSIDNYENRISDIVSSDTDNLSSEHMKAVSIDNDDNRITDIVYSDTDILSSEHMEAVSIDNDDNRISDIVSSDTDNISSEQQKAVSIDNNENRISDIVSSDTDNLSIEHLKAVSIGNDEKRISDTVSSDSNLLSSEHLKAVSIYSDDDRISDSVSSDTNLLSIEHHKAVSIDNYDTRISDIVSSDTDILSSEQHEAVSIDNDDTRISDNVSSDTNLLSSEQHKAVSIDSDDNCISDSVSSDTNLLSSEQKMAVSLDNDDNRIADSVSSDTNLPANATQKAVSIDSNRISDSDSSDTNLISSEQHKAISIDNDDNRISDSVSLDTNLVSSEQQKTVSIDDNRISDSVSLDTNLLSSEQHKIVSTDDNRISDSVSLDSNLLSSEQHKIVSTDDNRISDNVSSYPDLSSEQHKAESIDNDDNTISDNVSSDTNLILSEQHKAVSIDSDDNMILDSVSPDTNLISSEKQNAVSIDDNMISDSFSSYTDLSSEQHKAVSIDNDDNRISDSVSLDTDLLSTEQHKTVSVDNNRISDNVSLDTDLISSEQHQALSIVSDANMISDIVSSDTNLLSSEKQKAVSIDDNRMSAKVSSDTDLLSSEQHKTVFIDSDDNRISDSVSSDTNLLSSEQHKAVSIDNDDNTILDSVSSDTDLLSIEQHKAVSIDSDGNMISDSISLDTNLISSEKQKAVSIDSDDNRISDSVSSNANLISREQHKAVSINSDDNMMISDSVSSDTNLLSSEKQKAVSIDDNRISDSVSSDTDLLSTEQYKPVSIDNDDNRISDSVSSDTDSSHLQKGVYIDNVDSRIVDSVSSDNDLHSNDKHQAVSISNRTEVQRLPECESNVADGTISGNTAVEAATDVVGVPKLILTKKPGKLAQYDSTDVSTEAWSVENVPVFKEVNIPDSSINVLANSTEALSSKVLEELNIKKQVTDKHMNPSDEMSANSPDRKENGPCIPLSLDLFEVKAQSSGLSAPLQKISCDEENYNSKDIMPASNLLIVDTSIRSNSTHVSIESRTIDDGTPAKIEKVRPTSDVPIQNIILMTCGDQVQTDRNITSYNADKACNKIDNGSLKVHNQTEIQTSDYHTTPIIEINQPHLQEMKTQESSLESSDSHRLNRDISPASMASMQHVSLDTDILVIIDELLSAVTNVCEVETEREFTGLLSTRENDQKNNSRVNLPTGVAEPTSELIDSTPAISSDVISEACDGIPIVVQSKKRKKRRKKFPKPAKPADGSKRPPRTIGKRRNWLELLNDVDGPPSVKKKRDRYKETIDSEEVISTNVVSTITLESSDLNTALVSPITENTSSSSTSQNRTIEGVNSGASSQEETSTKVDVKMATRGKKNRYQHLFKKRSYHRSIHHSTPQSSDENVKSLNPSNVDKVESDNMAQAIATQLGTKLPLSRELNTMDSEYQYAPDEDTREKDKYISDVPLQTTPAPFSDTCITCPPCSVRLLDIVKCLDIVTNSDKQCVASDIAFPVTSSSPGDMLHRLSSLSTDATQQTSSIQQNVIQKQPMTLSSPSFMSVESKKGSKMHKKKQRLLIPPSTAKSSKSSRRYECKHCSYRTSFKHTIEEHVYHHTKVIPFKCGHCGASYGTRSGVILHHKRHHPGMFTSLVKSAGVKECDYYITTDKTTNSSVSYSDHGSNKDVHLGQNKSPKKLPSKDITPRKEPLYCCKYCSFHHPRADVLENHARHRHSDLIRFVCPLCNMAYCKYEAAMERHFEKWHPGEHVILKCETTFDMIEPNMIAIHDASPSTTEVGNTSQPVTLPTKTPTARKSTAKKSTCYSHKSKLSPVANIKTSKKHEPPHEPLILRIPKVLTSAKNKNRHSIGSYKKLQERDQQSKRIKAKQLLQHKGITDNPAFTKKAHSLISADSVEREIHSPTLVSTQDVHLQEDNKLRKHQSCLDESDQTMRSACTSGMYNDGHIESAMIETVMSSDVSLFDTNDTPGTVSMPTDHEHEILYKNDVCLNAEEETTDDVQEDSENILGLKIVSVCSLADQINNADVDKSSSESGMNKDKKLTDHCEEQLSFDNRQISSNTSTLLEKTVPAVYRSQSLNYNCKMCSAIVLDIQEIIQHLEITHNETCTLLCSSCTFQTHVMENMVLHLKDAHEDGFIKFDVKNKERYFEVHSTKSAETTDMVEDDQKLSVSVQKHFPDRKHEVTMQEDALFNRTVSDVGQKHRKPVNHVVPMVAFKPPQLPPSPFLVPLQHTSVPSFVSPPSASTEPHLPHGGEEQLPGTDQTCDGSNMFVVTDTPPSVINVVSPVDGSQTQMNSSVTSASDKSHKSGIVHPMTISPSVLTRVPPAHSQPHSALPPRLAAPRLGPPPVARLPANAGEQSRQPPPLIPMGAIQTPNQTNVSQNERPPLLRAPSQRTGSVLNRMASRATATGTVRPTILNKSSANKSSDTGDLRSELPDAESSVDEQDEDMCRRAFSVFNIGPRSRLPRPMMQQPTTPVTVSTPTSSNSSHTSPWQQFQVRRRLPVTPNVTASVDMMRDLQPNHMTPAANLSAQSHIHPAFLRPNIDSTRTAAYLAAAAATQQARAQALPQGTFNAMSMDPYHAHLVSHEASPNQTWACPYCHFSGAINKHSVEKHVMSCHPGKNVFCIPFPGLQR